ncbi:hypothetical protein PAL_GLEAN10024729 [Pteropus alecto]|uniref:Uncharacterized protein n=1 Tax=Pteropus alecto TaxID=9402 RepID=L5JYM6_PTEAL|nr:hypothetical protein PAL_GLEAN10024729 [Pteropus alecto]
MPEPLAPAPDGQRRGRSGAGRQAPSPLPGSVGFVFLGQQLHHGHSLLHVESAMSLPSATCGAAPP